ncbi:unnamed protein product [Cyprideis torosa]|uniref:Uncharacterized protein n=1 Tax=Cyprideis torosa TaxID=163714 RepID=A0A7R8WTR9_9CRUS|nr:unnamed protein product [Cyprideis torosa]CAG0905935.1 unnamed protein product [Cyprideis torosa]
MDSAKDLAPKTAEAAGDVGSAVSAKASEAKEKVQEKASGVDSAIGSKLQDVKDSDALKTEEEKSSIGSQIMSKASDVYKSVEEKVTGAVETVKVRRKLAAQETAPRPRRRSSCQCQEKVQPETLGMERKIV